VLSYCAEELDSSWIGVLSCCAEELDPLWMGMLPHCAEELDPSHSQVDLLVLMLQEPVSITQE
jgi:hypothetical protein